MGGMHAIRFLVCFQSEIQGEHLARMASSSSRARQLTRCLYEVLGVERDASTADIRRAYRKAALELHPDKVSISLPLSLFMCVCVLFLFSLPFSFCLFCLTVFSPTCSLFVSSLSLIHISLPLN